MKKPTHWVGSSRKDIKDFPEDVRRQIGFSLYAAECGATLASSVPLVGFGGGRVLEIIVPFDGNAYRAVYTVKFKLAVYVLHVFQKKSKSGIKTPHPDMRLIKKRLQDAENHYRKTYEKQAGKGTKCNEQGANSRS